MAIKRLIFWRHGQTDQNIQLRIQGSTDNPLNEAGVLQAQEVAPELLKLHPTRIYTSHLQRARATAAVLQELAEVPLEVDERFSERSYGLWEGLTNEEIKAGWYEQWQVWRRGEQPAGVGLETREHCGIRFRDAVLDAVAAVEKADSGREENLVFVSHGGVSANGIMSLLGMNPSTWVGFQGMDNCHWSVLVPRIGANPPWRISTYNRKYADTAVFDRPW